MEAAVSEESSEKGNQRQRGGRGQTSDGESTEQASW